MTAEMIKNRISEICSHFLFTYNGKNCGVDPFSQNDFDMWYGDDYHHADSIENVMNVPLFDGKTLTDIANKIEITEY
ncbi:MAG: hypothetical protein LUE25_01145 [Clostridiales bacterium]|nr:hypothetical protein [Clostridiales bacterium]